MHDEIRQPGGSRASTTRALPCECAPHARRVEIEHLQTLVDPASTGNRAASAPARAGRRLAAQREEAEGRRVPNSCEQLGAGDDRSEGALLSRPGGVDGVGKRESDDGRLEEALERETGRSFGVGRRCDGRVVPAPACVQ